MDEVINRIENTVNLTYKLNFKTDNRYGENLDNVNVVEAYNDVKELSERVMNSETMEETNNVDKKRLDGAVEYYTVLMEIPKNGLEKLDTNSSSDNIYKLDKRGETVVVEIENGNIPSIETKKEKYFYENGKAIATYDKSLKELSNYANDELLLIENYTVDNLYNNPNI